MTTQKGTIKLLVVLVPWFFISACVTSPGTSAIYSANQSPSGEERVMRGVVNGLYRYDPSMAAEELAKYDEYLSSSEISEYSQRYLVKVGIDREPVVAMFSPIVLSTWTDYVVLPAGWSHDLSTVSSKPRVINVGDIVDVRIQKGRRYDFFVQLVRKCNAPPAEGENPDWDIGCKTYEGYNERGFAGEYYTFRQF